MSSSWAKYSLASPPNACCSSFFLQSPRKSGKAAASSETGNSAGHQRGHFPGAQCTHTNDLQLGQGRQTTLPDCNHHCFFFISFFFLFLIKPRGKHQTNKLADNTAICSAKEMALAPGSGDHVLNHAEDQSILFYF